jgi:hypothetical protein
VSETRCPYCGFRFGAFAVNADEIPSLAPIVCESCGRVGLLEDGRTRKLAEGELEALKESPAWKEFLEPAVEIIEREMGKRS